MKLSTLCRRFSQSMTAAAFAEANEPETARLLLKNSSRTQTKTGRVALEKSAAHPEGTGNRLAQTDFS